MKYNKYKSKKMLIEYVNLYGKCEEREYLTLKSRIVSLSQEEMRHAVGEDIPQKYIDITMHNYDKDGSNIEKFTITSKELIALTNALNIRKPEKLKGKIITPLYEKDNESDEYYLIGFVRPQDKIKLEEKILSCPCKLVK